MMFKVIEFLLLCQYSSIHADESTTALTVMPRRRKVPSHLFLSLTKQLMVGTLPGLQLEIDNMNTSLRTGSS